MKFASFLFCVFIVLFAISLFAPPIIFIPSPFDEVFKP